MRNALERAADPAPIDRPVELLGQADPLSFARKYGLDVARDEEVLEAESGPVGTMIPIAEMGIGLAYFDDETQRARVLEQPDPDWAVIPDASFSMAVPEKLGPRLAGSGPAWPNLSGVRQAREAGITGVDAFVGILDSGVDADHAELAHNDIHFLHVTGHAGSGRCVQREVRGFDTHGHGTLVASLIAGRELGVAPAAQLHVASIAEGDTLEAPLGKMVHGLRWILRKFETAERPGPTGVLNISLGFPGEPPPDCAAGAYKQGLLAIRLMLATCREKGLLPIAPVGNEGYGRCDHPAAFPEVLAVGAVDKRALPAHFSGGVQGLPHCHGYGVAMPAAADRSYRGSSYYRDCTGTSFATAYVSGIAALYLSRRPEMSVEELRAVLTRDCILDAGVTRKIAHFADL